MQFSLVVLSQGGQHGKKIPITLPQFLIGRDHHCHLRPVSTLVSKRHCAFKVTQSQVIIQDLNSTNGTFVNDERLIGSRVLNDGDIIKLGPLTFRADIKSPVAVDEPTPPPGKSLDPMPSSPVVAPEDAIDDEPSTIGPGGATPEQADPDFSIDDEEDIAALLMDDEGGDIARDDPSVPDDLSGETTAMEMMLPPEMQEPKKKEKTEEEKKVDTSSAAAEILNKMYRRR